MVQPWQTGQRPSKGIIVRLKTIGKFGAVVQLVVLLIVQISTVAPGLARALQHRALVGLCRGDHRICGCQPDRVAARSCCCFLNKRPHPDRRSCCVDPARAGKLPSTAHDFDRSTPALSSLPCGGDPSFTSYGMEPIKFIRPRQLQEISVPVLATLRAPEIYRFLSRNGDPPDPPPKLSSLPMAKA
jgi:hypothetical protein